MVDSILDRVDSLFCYVLRVEVLEAKSASIRPVVIEDCRVESSLPGVIIEELDGKCATVCESFFRD